MNTVTSRPPAYLLSNLPLVSMYVHVRVTQPKKEREREKERKKDSPAQWAHDTFLFFVVSRKN